MTIRLTRISPTHHLFEYVRDGKRESLELETKSLLFHDVLHYAVETEAGLKKSFYGLLSKNGYENLTEGSGSVNKEIEVTERIVGPLTTVVKNDMDPRVFLPMIKNLFDSYGEVLPSWLTTEFVIRVKERMRTLMGKWNALPFGETMELEF